MSLLDFILGIAASLFITVFGLLFSNQSKRIDTLASELKTLDDRLRSAITAVEVRQIIDDKLNPLHVQINEVQSDIREIKDLLKRV